MFEFNKMRDKIFIISTAILIVAQIFSAALSISSFEKQQVQILSAKYKVLAFDLQRKLSTALKYGKTIDNFLGLDKLLLNIKDGNIDLNEVAIISPDGKVIETTNDQKFEKDDSYYSNILKHLDGKKTDSFFSNQLFHVLTPLLDPSNKWVGSIHFTVKERIVQEPVLDMININLQSIIIITVLVFFLLRVLLKIDLLFPLERRAFTQRILIFLVIIFGSAQISYSILNTINFRNSYLSVVKEKTQTQLESLTASITEILDKGLEINQLDQIDSIFTPIIKNSLEIQSINLLSNNKIIYSVDSKGVTKDPKILAEEKAKIDESNVTKDNFIQKNDIEQNDEVKGTLVFILSKKLIYEKSLDIVWDSGTILIVSLLFMVEIILFSLILMTRKRENEDEESSESDAIPENSYLIRMCAFLFMFSMDLCISFVTLYIKNLKNSYLTSFSQEFIMGLPISIEMFFAALAIIVAGLWMDKKGWHQPFLFGLILCIFGNVLSALSNDSLTFILSRGIVGCGYGLALISKQGFIFYNTPIKKRAQSISNLVAGIYSGSICGGVVGGMIADRINYNIIFLICSISIFITAFFTILFMRRFFTIPSVYSQSIEAIHKVSFKELVKYIFDRRISSLLLFSSLPSALCLVGFMYYAIPVYLKDTGATQSDIGRVLMVYGLFLIYLAPFFSKMVDRSENKKIFISLGGLMGGAALLIFAEYGGIVGSCIGIMLLGISSSFAFSAQTVFATQVESAQSLGPGNALSIYRSFERIGQVLGPIVIGAVIAALQFEKGMLIVGSTYFFLSLLFYVFSSSTKNIIVQKNNKENSNILNMPIKS
ncbi:MAG: MFS transporter [Silvanigrellaceae bacterium]|nr:MFS transporter [Silvanigrellaceae bacterium]